MKTTQEIEGIINKIYNLAEEGISKATEENKPELKTLFFIIYNYFERTLFNYLKLSRKFIPLKTRLFLSMIAFYNFRLKGKF